MVAAVGPGVRGRAVVSGEHDDGVVRHAELLDQIEQFTDVVVQLHHAVGVDAVAALALILLAEVCAVVRPRHVVPYEERLAGVDSVGDEALRLLQDLLVEVSLPLLPPGTEILDLLGAVRKRLRVDDASLLQAKLLLLLLVLREVVLLWIFAGVQVIEDPEELVEAVVGRQVLVAVAQVVLAELPGGVAQRLEHLGEGRITVLDALLCAWKPDRAQARSHWVLAQQEGGTARRARRLGIVIHEDHALVGDAVDIRRGPAHHSAVVGTDVPHADVVAPDNQNVGLACLCPDLTTEH